MEQLTGLQSRGVLARQAFVKTTIRGGSARILVRSRRGGYCEPDYFMDGLRVDALDVLTIPASDLEGIEICRGVSEVPAAFQRSTNALECGVILAWIRRG